MASGNKTLGRAKKAKEDEFYTRLEDIERELAHYRTHFKGKTVLCNCDDPRVSNFSRQVMAIPPQAPNARPCSVRCA